MFIRDGEIVYLDLLGNDFNEAQILDQYNRVAQLYDGGTYKVYRIEDKDSNESFVLKIVNFEEGSEGEKNIEEFCKKLKMLEQLDHRNI